MTAQEIIQDINNHLTNSSKQFYGDFYIGITNDIDRRLFVEHNVPQNNHWWIYRAANNDTIARTTEKHFLDKGMKGDTGGGGADCVYVYCYEISNSTIE